MRIEKTKCSGQSTRERATRRLISEGETLMIERPVRRALLSVWDKAGLIDFAQALAAMDIELIQRAARRERFEKPDFR